MTSRAVFRLVGWSCARGDWRLDRRQLATELSGCMPVSWRCFPRATTASGGGGAAAHSVGPRARVSSCSLRAGRARRGAQVEEKRHQCPDSAESDAGRLRPRNNSLGPALRRRAAPAHQLRTAARLCLSAAANRTTLDRVAVGRAAHVASPDRRGVLAARGRVAGRIEGNSREGLRAR